MKAAPLVIAAARALIKARGEFGTEAVPQYAAAVASLAEAAQHLAADNTIDALGALLSASASLMLSLSDSAPEQCLSVLKTIHEAADAIASQ